MNEKAGVRIFMNICLQIGFRHFASNEINKKLWQSTYMFDFVLKK